MTQSQAMVSTAPLEIAIDRNRLRRVTVPSPPSKETVTQSGMFASFRQWQWQWHVSSRGRWRNQPSGWRLRGGRDRKSRCIERASSIRLAAAIATSYRSNTLDCAESRRVGRQPGPLRISRSSICDQKSGLARTDDILAETKYLKQVA